MIDNPTPSTNNLSLIQHQRLHVNFNASLTRRKASILSPTTTLRPPLLIIIKTIIRRSLRRRTRRIYRRLHSKVATQPPQHELILHPLLMTLTTQFTAPCLRTRPFQSPTTHTHDQPTIEPIKRRPGHPLPMLQPTIDTKPPPRLRMPIAPVPRDLAPGEPLARQLAVAGIAYQAIGLQGAVLVNIIDGRRGGDTVPDEILGAYLSIAGVGLLFGE